MSTTVQNQIITRNYSSSEEQSNWWYVNRWSRDCKYSRGENPYSKQLFRTRRCPHGLIGFKTHTQSLRTCIGNKDDIGTFVKLTNSYVVIGLEKGSENFQSEMQDDLPELPVIKTTLGGCCVIGCMCVGNKYGLIVPNTIYETELKCIKEGLPETVEVKKLEEILSALGNVITCNDKVALVHPDLDKESEEIIENTLQVEVFRHIIADNPLVGSCCILNSHGGLVHSEISNAGIENLSSLLQLNLVAGTVNRGNKNVASGVIANDKFAYAGMLTTGQEFKNIEAAFQLRRN